MRGLFRLRFPLPSATTSPPVPPARARSTHFLARARRDPAATPAAPTGRARDRTGQSSCQGRHSHVTDSVEMGISIWPQP